MKHSAEVRQSQLIQILNELGPLTSIRLIEVFIAIATLDEGSRGVNYKDLERRLGVPTSAMSRNIEALQQRRPGGRSPGLDLVITTSDPEDSRAKIVSLNASGHRLWERMKAIMES